jgi:hypothetical protein
MSKKKKCPKRVVKVKQPVYNTDTLAVGVYQHLVSDFRRFFGKDFAVRRETTLLRSIVEFRELEPVGCFSTEAAFFKANYQLDSLLKKYRFDKDVFSDVELKQRTYDKYRSQQISIAQPIRRTEVVHRVLQRARKIARKILGPFQESDMYDFIKFGKKSSIGCPLAFAYIDVKLSDVGAFTGSSETSKWFFSEVVKTTPALERIVRRLYPEIDLDNLPNQLCVESLTLKTVPKSWGIERPITPLTLLMLLYSFGIGGLATERLREYGLDIRTLQNRHRKLVKYFSRSRSHATVDLQHASESCIAEICNAVLPRSWYVALKKATTHRLLINEDDEQIETYTASILPMGNGATFPLETLIFYVIVEAVRQLSGTQGFCSAYGDDLIYPSSMHHIICHVFDRIGFKINKQKSYVKMHFRESCGADYFTGTDVRPFYLPGQHQLLSRSKYLSYIYKVYNGLCCRWDALEISSTLYYLLHEASRLGLKLHRVPPTYPATAGIHTSSPEIIPLDTWFFDWVPILLEFKHGSRAIHFTYLLEQAPKRYVTYQDPYYLLALMGEVDDPTDEEVLERKFKERTFWLHPTKARIEGLVGGKPVLRWQKYKRYRKYKCKDTVKVKKKFGKRPYVAEKQRTRLKESPGSVSDWI